jgi:hyperosmotically inducible periplasmic protein
MRKLSILSMAVFLVSLVAYIGCASQSAQTRSTGTYVDDKTISAKIKADLIGDPLTKAREIDVTTYKGIVELSGFVDTPEASQRAEQIARNTKGVVDVKNNLIVK